MIRLRTCLLAAVALLLVWQTPSLSQQSAEPTGASSSQPQSAKPDEIDVLPVTPPQKSPPNPLQVPEIKIPNFASCPLADLQQTVPELAGLKLSSDATGLSTLLKNVGKEILEIVGRTPNPISHEKVISMYGANSMEQNFSYLVLPHSHPEGNVVFDEFRVDLLSGKKFQTEDIEKAIVSHSHGDPSIINLPSLADQLSAFQSGGPPLAQGFANMWIYFYPVDQADSSFRSGTTENEWASHFGRGVFAKTGFGAIPGDVSL